MTDITLLEEEVRLLHKKRHTNPHRFLGLHSQDSEKTIRFWAPKQEDFLFLYQKKLVSATQVHPQGLFTYVVPKDTKKTDYQIIYPSKLKGYDPYSFVPTVSHVDAHLFSEGIHYEIYNLLGAHIIEHEGILGTQFCVWAPHAKRVSLVADFNLWRPSIVPMRKIENSGIWEIFIPCIHNKQKYKYAILTPDGQEVLKTDPYAHEFELRPQTASVVSPVDNFCWRDADWIKKREISSMIQRPMNIYEMHLGSWKKNENTFYNYKEIAASIVPYLKDMGYTHLEILPVTEHPLDESWGYQTTGYFAPTSRFGNLEDFQYFINHLHMHDIGVILDWVPGHFPKDAFSLASFDGTPLYENPHPVMGVHAGWDTHIFDYDKKPVTNFLISSALFWIQKMHIDAIRVDAVEAMLFLDYGRDTHEWEPNEQGGRENLSAIEFLKHLNSIIHAKCPGVLMIAEDSSIFPGVTKPVEWGGLGFDLKWNLGWMNDTLNFISKDPIYRKYHMDDIFRGYEEIHRERYVLPVSHDEVVHEKRSLLMKMPLDRWHQFAQMRLYYSMSICHPGKKLFFMGTEIAPQNEWNVKKELDWHLLQDHAHLQWKKFVRHTNHFYLNNKALWEIDFHKKGFFWIDRGDTDHSIFSYLRIGTDSMVACVHNFTPKAFDHYVIRLPNVKTVVEILNSDDASFGGTNRMNKSPKILEDKSGFCINMPPLTTMVFQIIMNQ